MDVWTEIRAEREDMAGLLSSLSDEQWNTQSLCDAWRVRDVVGHLLSGANPSAGAFLGAIVGSGFNFNKANREVAKKEGSRSAEQLVAAYRAAIPSTKKPVGASAAVMLNDNLIHAQDIRRALGMPRSIPTERLRVVADSLKGNGFPFGTKKKIAGLTLKATDADWSTGSGPEVSGTLEALVMTMAGRTSALADCSGEGLATLKQRYATS